MEKGWQGLPAFFFAERWCCRMATMTAKQKRFCDEYLIDLNATQAAIRAGYSKKTAYAIGQQNLNKLELKKYIEERMAEKESQLIADQNEVLKYLTAVIRDKTDSETVVVEGVGEGCSVAKIIRVKPSEKDKLKAAELLGKRYGIYTDKIESDIQQVIIIDDLDEYKHEK